MFLWRVLKLKTLELYNYPKTFVHDCKIFCSCFTYHGVVVTFSKLPYSLLFVTFSFQAIFFFARTKKNTNTIRTNDLRKALKTHCCKEKHWKNSQSQARTRKVKGDVLLLRCHLIWSQNSIILSWVLQEIHYPESIVWVLDLVSNFWKISRSFWHDFHEAVRYFNFKVLWKGF